MTERISPIVRLRKVVRRLAKWRKDAGMVQDDVIAALQWSKPKLSRFENGEQVPGPAEVLALAAVYGISNEERDHYVALALQARQKGWWKGYASSTIAPHFEEFVGLESEASSIREFGAGLIPGLLQTERYVFALMRAWLPGTEEEHLQERAKFRLHRQERLHEPDPLFLSAVIHESALDTLVGGPNVMREQLEHLTSSAELPHITIQVLPFSTGAVPALGAPFITMSFPDHDDPDISYVEYLTGCFYSDDEDEVALYHLNYRALEDRALSPADSAELIAKKAQQL